MTDADKVRQYNMRRYRKILFKHFIQGISFNNHKDSSTDKDRSKNVIATDAKDNIDHNILVQDFIVKQHNNNVKMTVME